MGVTVKQMVETCGWCGSNLLGDDTDEFDVRNGSAEQENFGVPWCPTCETATCEFCGLRIEPSRYEPWCRSCGPRW